jgi:hypothetical protein
MRHVTWAVVVVLAAGCQSPRVVQRTPDEGVIALPANSDGFPNYFQSAARTLIKDHVGTEYEIVEEKEVTTEYATTNTVAREGASPLSLVKRETVTNTTVATPKKEWQIHYRRVMPRTNFPGNAVVQTQYVAGADAPKVRLPDTQPVPPPVLGPTTP